MTHEPPSTGVAVHTVPPSEVFTLLQTSPDGLSHAEAQARLQKYGLNAITEIRGRPLYLKFLSNFTHLMAILLWIGGFVGMLAKLPELGIAIWMVNVINGVFSFWQEFKAEKATEALKKLLPTYVHLLREGEESRVLAEELVPGDVILFEEGDRISADARLIQASDLQVNQSTLTGESSPVRKLSDAVYEENLTRMEIPNLVFAGTSVAAGTGRAVVHATGMNTEFGEIAELTQSMGDDLSPLQKEMEVVTRVVSIVAIALGVIFFALSVLMAGMKLSEAFIFSLGLLVAFIPEGLLPTVTLALAMGVQRMSKRNALIKRLSAVETLGSTTVICTDKTGTLTQNEMTVCDLWLSGKRLKVTGGGYAPEGDILLDDARINGQLGDDVSQLFGAAALCNNSRLLPPSGDVPRWTILGDPTEAALKVVAAKGGIALDNLVKVQARLRELPFDSRRKRMTTIHQVREAGQFTHRAYTKGAPKEVLALCSRIWQKGEAHLLTDDLRAEIMGVNDDYARGGLRVLGIALRKLGEAQNRPASMADYTVETVENDLTFLGLIAMMDPPRPEVTEAVKKCHGAGIRVVMITGDYGLTAESIARRIGIIKSAHVRVIAGAELDEIDDAALAAAFQEEVIFARVAPEHKLRVVSVLQDLGHVVAVTGDGVNDAPALKKADIGVAMGVSGTDVAKEAAAMILTDDNFASIVNAVEEGRGVYANIKKFTTYIFTSNAPEAVPFILFAFTGARIPLALNVMHILSIDLGTDMVPALGLGTEPPEPGIMDRPPRSPHEHVITRGLLLRAYLWLGSIQGLAVMAAFYFMYWTNGYSGQWLDLPDKGFPYESATAMALAAVVVTQIGNVFTQRTERTSIFKLRWFSNRLIWIGIVTELALIAMIVYLPFFHKVIGTSSFPLVNWLFLFAWTPSLIIVDEIRKAVLRWQERRHRAHIPS